MIEYIDPLKLIKCQRFDLVAKYIYAINYQKNSTNSGGWFLEIYMRHIEVFNGFVEADESNKYGADAFINSFNHLLNDIGKNGFNSEYSPVPINNGIIIDGAHRTTACLLHNKPIPTEKSAIESGTYDYSWFRKAGLDEWIMDAIAIEACKLRENTFVVVIYPSAEGMDDDLVELIKKKCEIWYRKDIAFMGNGPVNLIKALYKTELWLGDDTDGYYGAHNKATWCFDGAGPLRSFLVESTLPEILKLKKEIRNIFSIDNHSVHITDYHDEAVDVSKLLFNENSIDFINRSAIKESRWLETLMTDFKIWIKENKLNSDNYCIDSSAVLCAYGLRECRDLDFLSIEGSPDTGIEEIGCHNSEIKYYKKNIADIVNGPLNHFFYNGLKFCSINTVKNMKKNRGENKDLEDVDLILSIGGVNLVKANKFKRWLKVRFLYQKLRFLAFRCRYYLKKFIKKLQRSKK